MSNIASQHYVALLAEYARRLSGQILHKPSGPERKRLIHEYVRVSREILSLSAQH